MLYVFYQERRDNASALLPFVPMPERLYHRAVISLLLALTLTAKLAAQLAPPGHASLQQARTLRAHGHLDEAAATLNQILVTDPENVIALTDLSLIKLDQNDQTAAESLLTHALDISPNDPAANNALGYLFLSAHRNPEAMDHFETTLAIAPHDQPARTGELHAATALALESKAAGNLQAALLCLEHAAQRLPDNVDLLIDIGLVSGDLHLYHRADRALTAALALDPSNSRALYTAGRVATDTQHLPDAEKYLRAYLSRNPSDATAHFGLGHVLAMELNTADAKAEFEQSIALQPKQSESFYQLGVLAANAHEDGQAADLFRKVLSRNPQHGGALTGLGETAYRQGNYIAAQSSLSAAVKAAPDYQPAHYYLGLTLARLGQSSASTKELETATELTRQQQSKAAPEPSEAPAP